MKELYMLFFTYDEGGGLIELFKKGELYAKRVSNKGYKYFDIEARFVWGRTLGDEVKEIIGGP